MNCESGEVNLSTLPPGACFELQLSRTTALRGVLIRHGTGSVEVNVGESRNEHWCADAPVVYFAGQEASRWLVKTQTEETQMANGKKKTNKAVKTLLVVRYTATDKKAEHLMNEEKKSYAALAYRAIKANPGCTFDDVWREIYRTVSGRTEGKTPKNSVHAILHHFVKDGLVKRSEKREEIEAVKTVAA